MKSLMQFYLSGVDQRRKPPISFEPDLRRMTESATLIDKFEEHYLDTGAQQWLEQAGRPRLVRGFFSDCIRRVASRTTANAIMYRGGMFVLSTEQARTLLRPEGAPLPAHHRPPHSAPVPPTMSNTPTSSSSLDEESVKIMFDSALDVGAGDGGVTAMLSPMCRTMAVTEDNWAMRWRLWLASSGAWQTLSSSQPLGEPKSYDLVSVLNVLDRADKPLSLLRSVSEVLRDDGLLLLAVVLPWCPFVEDGAKQRAPAEQLPMAGGLCCKGASFEQSLQVLVDKVLTPTGWELVRWTKVPYLCEGSATHAYYKLDDALMVLRKKRIS